MNILRDFYHPKVLVDDHIFSPSGIYHQFPGTSEYPVSNCGVLLKIALCHIVNNLECVAVNLSHSLLEFWITCCVLAGTVTPSFFLT